MSDNDCGPNGVCEFINGQGLCRKKPDVTAPDQCTPVCLASEVCTTEGCKPRFSALKIKEPANGASLKGGTISIVAELTEQYATSAEWPGLVVTATRQDGSPAGSIPLPTRNGNTYTALWTVPNLDEQVTVTAASPEANLSDTVTVDVDTVPPTFTISFSNPPPRTPGSYSVQAEQQDQTSGYEGAFRRDETVTVTISSNDDSATKAELAVIGIGAGGAAGRAEPVITVDLQPRITCPGGQPVCGEKTVDLSAPEMSDFRGAMRFQVSGQDRSGNPGTSAEAQLRVTRWKWAFDIADRIEVTPAIGHQGTVYFGTYSGARVGRTLGVDESGRRKWIVNSGDVTGSPAVGTLVGSEEYVYVAARVSGDTRLYAFRSDGTEKARCTYAESVDVPSSIAVGMVGGVETAVTTFNGSSQTRIVSIRPDVAGAECLEATSSFMPHGNAGAVVLEGQNVFFGADDTLITSYDISTTSREPRSGWPGSLPSLVRGLAIVAGNVYGNISNVNNPSSGNIFTVSVEGGNPELAFPVSNDLRVFGFAIGSGEIAYFGAETGSSKDLYSLRLETGPSTTLISSAVGTMRGSPVVGRRGNLYTVNANGHVRAWALSSPTPLWGVDLAQGAGDANISPTLDCLRDSSGQAVANSRLGVLYVAASTKVHAFIVDSPGMDPNAPWPKYQHDARNTGNPATPITSCP
ncbi:hypothetical protein POL68_25225 [Stigmatella sp. ncwal1]|uniref:Uncharacterized protein n=1 Tax=Stigmatella ashevillensis TaxID=2995309 RepID=A0ABT5DHF8_9BACT|nr:hypothetical protein [Stigmatella ashevillena]MDC0711796.1 hypothetical protein [Stigmatella ashevillena]